MRLHGKLRRRLATSEINSCHIAYANQRGPKVNYPRVANRGIRNGLLKNGERGGLKEPTDGRRLLRLLLHS